MNHHENDGKGEKWEKNYIKAKRRKEKISQKLKDTF